LIATAFGLGIAITSLLPFNFLNTKMEDARHEMESAAAQLELMTQPTGAIAVPVATGTPSLVVTPAPASVHAHERAAAAADVQERIAREDALRRKAELKLKREAL